MKVTREQAEQNRLKMVEAAARLYRERGIEGIGIGELSRSVGLTHGGFYGQFPGGKEELACAAIERSFATSGQRWSEASSLEEVAERYLRPSHIDDCGEGCAIPALAADASRAGGVVSEAFTEGVEHLLGILAARTAGDTPQAKREQAMAALASMAGALLIARAVSDETLALEVLEVVKDRLRGEE